jgi:predicted O-methyltransferase YrrM
MSATELAYVYDGPAYWSPHSTTGIAKYDARISWMLWPERMLVYSTVYGLQPQRCLEIGTFQGGSAQLIVAALDDIGTGQLICVDPNPRVSPEVWSRISHRAQMVSAPSPEALTQAEQLAGGKFDFAFIDGDHTYDGLVRDVEGTLPVLANDAYLLFHDAHYFEVADGLKMLFAKYPRQLQDMGIISKPKSPDPERPDVFWGGIRMARFTR